MATLHSPDAAGRPEPFPLDQDVAEVSLLLPRAQAVGLMEAAKQQGITVAQFLRRLVGRALAEATPRRSGH
jgi:hypothetical protein